MARKIILDEDGDVCLRLQELDENESQSGNKAQDCSNIDESKATLDLIVSSKILATASPVFKSMFYGKFKEAADLAVCQASSKLYVQELPDDDTETTITLCALLHFKDEHVPEDPTSLALVGLVDLSHKYLCVRAIKLPCQLWLKRRIEELYMVLPGAWEDGEEPCSQHIGVVIKSLCQCLFVAYILDTPHEYATVFNRIVLAHNGAIKHNSNLRSYLENLEFRHDIIGSLASQRAKCLAVIYDKMMDNGCMTLHSGSDMAPCDAMAMGHFVNTLIVEEIWPKKRNFEGISISKIFRTVPILPKKLETAYGFGEKFRCGHDFEEHKPREWAVELVQACSTLEDRLFGRSGVYYSQHEYLDCLKSSGSHKRLRNGGRKQECRIKHKHT